MNIEDLTIREARELVALFGGQKPASVPTSYGLAVVVADRGFVYIGRVAVNGDMCEISECRNIRYWGTDNGLSQLVNDGPTSKSKIDESQKFVFLPLRAVISIHPVEVKVDGKHPASKTKRAGCLERAYSHVHNQSCPLYVLNQRQFLGIVSGFVWHTKILSCGWLGWQMLALTGALPNQPQERILVRICH